MKALILMFGITLVTEVPCPLMDKAKAGWTASAALEEIAQERGAGEHSVGAVLILWREDACDALEQRFDLLPQTQRALEDECRQVIHLPAGTEAQYLEAARRPIQDRQPTLVSLAWATPPASGRSALHTFLVADGANALRVTSPGYGRLGKTSSECVASPWALAAADGL